MKAYSRSAAIAVFITVFVPLLFVTTSCSKEHMPPASQNQGPSQTRIVRFELFTASDFSGLNETIQFTLHMQTSTGTIFDSALSAMSIQDIPDSLHPIVFEKRVPGNDTSTLAVGFLYNIVNVGYSWYMESFPSGDTLKTIRYSFK